MTCCTYHTRVCRKGNCLIGEACKCCCCFWYVEPFKLLSKSWHFILGRLRLKIELFPVLEPPFRRKMPPILFSFSSSPVTTLSFAFTFSSFTWWLFTTFSCFSIILACSCWRAPTHDWVIKGGLSWTPCSRGRGLLLAGGWLRDLG